MEIGLFMGGLFFILSVAYFGLVVFAPEWVGIQGKKARQIEASHQSNDENKDQDQKPPQA